MKSRVICIFLVSFTYNIFSQFPEDIVIGPTINGNFAKNHQQIRLNLRLHIPGDYVDLEADILSFSLFSKQEMIDRFGISWISFLWIPPALVKKRIEFAKIPEMILLGLNAFLNPTLSVGNNWIRGYTGWKNDFYIFREFLWVFDPNIGLKVSFPENKFTDGAVRLGVSFPSFIGTGKIIQQEFLNFNPRLAVSIDILLMYAEIYIRGT